MKVKRWYYSASFGHKLHTLRSTFPVAQCCRAYANIPVAYYFAVCNLNTGSSSELSRGGRASVAVLCIQWEYYI